MTIKAGGSDSLQPDQMHIVHPRGRARCPRIADHRLGALVPAGRQRRVRHAPVQRFACRAQRTDAVAAGASRHGRGHGGHRNFLAGALGGAGGRRHRAAVTARAVRQAGAGRKSDVADSLWLVRICQFGLCRPSHVTPRNFRQVRQLSRYRRKLVGERSRACNRIHKTLPSLAHRRRWRSPATDTERGYRGGLQIRRLVGMRQLTAEFRDRGCAGEVRLHHDNVSQ